MKRVIAAALLLSSTAGAAPPRNGISTPVTDRRPADQTYLTAPEWFLVFSPEEYADYLADRPASRFPFFAHIGQFWNLYADVARASSRYPFNGGYHVMINVIGISTSLEYGLKGFYERAIGRFAELTAAPLGKAGTTPEDKLGARVARDYVAFIKRHPWYEFDFTVPLHELWTEIPLTGPSPLRKWERRYLLTSEYLVKAGYAKLIERAARASYDRPLESTMVIADGVTTLPQGVTSIAESGSTKLLQLPRYQAFTPAAIALAREGARFHEIAGNSGNVLVSVIGRSGSAPQAGTVLYTQPILTRPGFERKGIVFTAASLANGLNALTAAEYQIEHVYDF